MTARGWRQPPPYTCGTTMTLTLSLLADRVRPQPRTVRPARCRPPGAGTRRVHRGAGGVPEPRACLNRSLGPDHQGRSAPRRPQHRSNRRRHHRGPSRRTTATRDSPPRRAIIYGPAGRSSASPTFLTKTRREARWARRLDLFANDLGEHSSTDNSLSLEDGEGVALSRVRIPATDRITVSAMRQPPP